MGPLKSETFTSDGANASGQFHKDKRPVQNAAATSAGFAIAYDASTQSYTISTAGRSATFGPADLVTSDSPDLMSFQRSAPDNEALTMTRSGTSGPLNYQYVKGGAWERATRTGDQLDFSYDPFTFGVETPDAALRRTGTGSYAVALVGTRAMSEPYAMLGDGILQVDFQRGMLSSSGRLRTIDVSANNLIKADGSFFGEASLMGAANAFSGSFVLDDGTRLTGGWAGRFYGPGSEEVGAVWHMTSPDGQIAAGYLLGRQDGTIPPFNTSIARLEFAESFEHQFSQLSFEDSGGSTSAPDPAWLRSTSQLSVDPANGQFTYTGAGGIDTRFRAADRDTAASDSTADVYRMTDATGAAYTLTLNKAGASNPAIALTYASFGHWEKAQGTDRLDRWFAWGIRTNPLQIPAGTARFDGILRGTAVRSHGGAVYSLNGTSRFDMNFSTGNFTGSLNPLGISLVDDSPHNFGSFAIANGKIQSDAGLHADIVNGANAYLGFFEGALFGPHAAELGGSFRFQSEAGNGSNAMTLSGAIVAKRSDP